MNRVDLNKTKHTKQEISKFKRTSQPFACQTLAFYPTLVLLFILTNTFGQTPNSLQFPTFKPVTPTQNKSTTSNFNNTPTKPTQPRTNTSGTQNLTRQQREELYKVLSEEDNYKRPQKTVRVYNGTYRFADKNSEQYQKGISFYKTAFNQISKMMEGSAPIDLKKAVFLSENAILKDAISYDLFTQQIEKLKKLVQQIAKNEKLDLSNDIAVHYAIQKLFSDTIIDEITGKTFYPFRYDFNDYLGDDNFAQTTVSKLLASGKGQCESMPLLYSILANEFNTESFLSFSPSHSYIKFKDQFGSWYNFETTNGMNTSDSWVIGSGFVKVEAIKSRIFTEPINTKQILAHLLVELAVTHEFEYGYEIQSEFIDKVLEKALEVFPNDIFAWMCKSNLATAQLDYSLWEVGFPTEQELPNYPVQQKQLNELMDLYSAIDDMGFTAMPKEAYQEWLQSLEKEKQKQESKEFKFQIKTKALD